MRPTDERGRPIGASPGVCRRVIEATRSARVEATQSAGGHAAGFTRRPVSI